MAVVGMRRFWLGKAMPAVLAAALCVWCVPASALADVGEGAALADAALADPADNALADGELPADASAALAGDAVIESTEGLGGESDPDAVSEGGSDLAVAGCRPVRPRGRPGRRGVPLGVPLRRRARGLRRRLGRRLRPGSSVSFPAWSEAGGQDDIAWVCRLPAGGRLVGGRGARVGPPLGGRLRRARLRHRGRRPGLRRRGLLRGVGAQGRGVGDADGGAAGRRALHGGGEGGPRLVPLRRRVGAAARVVGRGRPGRRRVAWGRAGAPTASGAPSPRPSRTAAPSAPTRRTPT